MYENNSSWFSEIMIAIGEKVVKEEMEAEIMALGYVIADKSTLGHELDNPIADCKTEENKEQ